MRDARKASACSRPAQSTRPRIVKPPRYTQSPPTGRLFGAAPSSEGGERIVLEREEREKERKRKGKRKEKRKKREKREGKGKERKEKRKKKRERSCKKEKEGRRRMVEEKKERRKEEKKEREERVGGESVPCTSTAAEASDRRPSWTCTSAGSRTPPVMRWETQHPRASYGASPSAAL